MNKSKVLVDFNQMSWKAIAPGLLEKEITQNKKRLRLLRFTDGFIEQEWCRKGHIGYVLEGRCGINFNGILKFFESDQALFIEPGNDYKHKMVLGKNESVTLFLVEDL